MEVIGVNDPLILCIDPLHDEWLIRWHVDEPEDGYVSAESKIVKGKPTLEQIKEIVMGWVDQQTNMRVLSGYRYKEHMVWLNIENQSNYFRAYVLAVLSQGAILPITFKVGTDKSPHLETFSNLEDLSEFVLGAFRHISDSVEAGWKRKYQDIDWSLYEQD